MKYLTGGFVGVVLTLFLIAISPLYAQDMTPFWQWPALLKASDEFVAKRGTNADGTVSNELFVRQGWGPRVKSSLNEFKQWFRHDLPEDRYVNLQDVAISNLEQGEWTANDRRNCPGQPRKRRKLLMENGAEL